MNKNLANLIRPNNLKDFICDNNLKIIFENIIKNNENGFVLNRFSVEDYSEKLRIVLKNKDLYNNMRKNNMAVSENFGWNKVAERITKITESVLK